MLKRILKVSKPKQPVLNIGALPNGPTHCIQCCKPFKAGEAWRRLKSNPDPEYGAYVIGIHEHCAGGKSI